MTKVQAEVIGEIVALLDIAERSVGIATQAGFTSSAERRANSNTRRLIRLARQKVSNLDIPDEDLSPVLFGDNTGSAPL